MAHKLHIQIFTAQGSIVFEGDFSHYPVVIGRAPGHDIVLPQGQISRDQLRIDWSSSAELFQVENLSSKNRTFSKGIPFEKKDFSNKSEFQIEVADLRVRCVPESAILEETKMVSLGDSDLAAQSPSPSVRNFLRDRKHRYVGAGLVFGIVLLGIWMTKFNQTSLNESELTAKVREGIFEVVYPRAEDDFVVYEKELPQDALSFKERTDPFVSIGTAFAVENGVFVSAAHVFNLHIKRPKRPYYLRDSQGKTYEIASVVGHSNRKDLITFTLTQKPERVKVLQLTNETKVGDQVFTLGNALGEGVALRSGVLSSFTPEPHAGAWKHIRFSAAASPGNSGGPLLNNKGQVVGVVVMKNGEENLNFAVPVDLLGTLSSKEAEFVYSGAAEYESGQRLAAGEWVNNESLPDTLDNLMLKASAALVKNYTTHRKVFDEKFADKIFPGDPTLKDTLIETDAGRDAGFFELDKDKSEKWALSKVNGNHRDLKNEGSFWFASAPRGSDRMEFVYYPPKSASLNDYWLQPKKLFDLVLRETAWSRPYGRENVVIKSYGEPHEMEFWEDSLERRWATWIWRTQFDQKSHILSCLPFPKSVSCEWSYVDYGDEALTRFYGKVNAARRMRSFYSGTVKRWQEFLALEPAWIPKVLREASIEAVAQSPSRGQISLLNKKFKFNTKDEDDEVSVVVFWTPQNPKKLEVSGVIFYGKRESVQLASNYSLYRAPASKASESYIETWKKLKTKVIPFNNQVGPLDSNNLILRSPSSVKLEGESEEALWLATCQVSSFASQSLVQAYVRECRGMPY